ncbi:MAG TPA: helicase-related protein [Verrucomicrobiota bacterium]|nr:helicase-related protein [Verrucomicrobiota bacterium]HQL76759.1 helicase-related protein [Verrucomicrobiota bacterium]
MAGAASNSGIRDNHRRGLVADFLKAKIGDGSRLSIVSAYFTIYAYEALKEHLDRIDHLDFLFGEPRFISSLDPDKTENKAFLLDGHGLQLANRLQQKRVARECAEWIRQKVAIRSVRHAQLLHGKMYHIANAGVEEAILGSSNFTVHGLGLGAGNNNIELNLEVDSARDRRDLKAWFDELWNEPGLVADVKQEVLLYLDQLYQNPAPEFIYYKTLFHVFENFLADQEKGGLLDQNIKIVDTGIWQALFEFQRDGVKGAINKILKHNGCILADSVGLGKTFEALAVIKYFELKNERVLVLCPKKLRENWTVYRHNDALNPFIADRFRYDVLSHTDLSRDGGKSGDLDLATFNWGNFDLVVIDESHNFRNNTPGRRDEDGNLIRSRYQRLMDDIIKAGVKTKVLLLSATPVNNDLRDLRNQIYFLTENNDHAFKDSIGIPSLKEALAVAQKTFSLWAKKKSGERQTKDLLEKLSSAFFKLLDELTIARSRKHILRYYKSSIAALGGFPERRKPESIFSDTDLQRRFLSYDRLNAEIGGYKLSLFAPSRYLSKEARPLYTAHAGDPFSQADREKFLVGMMKVNFLKRLESSVHSFEITMERTIAKIEALEHKIRNYQAMPDQNPESESLELDLETPGGDEELEAALLVGGRYKYELKHLELAKWLKDLQRDKEQLSMLHASAKDVTPDRDAKLKELKRLIERKVKAPTTNKLGQPNRKVLVFTAFADTASYLFKELTSWARKDLGIHIALVAGSGDNHTTFGKSDFNQILTNFSPRSKNRAKMPSMPQTEEIDLLIATDCISEGQNLQDCDYLINYDIHWNPVRIIQRFGRIDRIGSVNTAVQLVNFWPTQDLDKYVNLKNRVEARMALVDIAATFEDNILKPDEIEELVHEDLRYRDKQLLRLREEVLDLEDFSESVALNEFTLDDFRIELSKYIEANRQLLEAAPLGLYAVVPPHPEHQVIAPGVIWCFRQKPAPHSALRTPQSEVNPLQPYYLVYVRHDGTVRFTFAQPKQILEIYRLLCAGKTQAHEQLCQLFDAESNNGADMAPYNKLLEAAVDSIARTFQKRVAAGLQSGRDFRIPDQEDQARDTTDFDLVTWLVIKAV